MTVVEIIQALASNACELSVLIIAIGFAIAMVLSDGVASLVRRCQCKRSVEMEETNSETETGNDSQAEVEKSHE